jgi:alkylation response protein AidB-like acyl-CoA dehydrogenase
VDFELDGTLEAVVQVAAKAPEAELLRLAVPTWLGGDGLGVLETMVLLTEIGRRGHGGRAMATLALGVLPLARWGTREQQAEFLTAPALTAAIREPTEVRPVQPRTVASPDLAISGTKVGVPYADGTDLILVPVSWTTGGTAVLLVDPAADGVDLTPTPTAGGTTEHTLHLNRAVASGVLGAGLAGREPRVEDGPDAVVTDLYWLAVAGACAVGDGALAGALALTTEHVGRREQFGRPLATFQAVAQQIADVYMASRTLHLAVQSASWRLGTDRDAGEDLDVAAYWLASQAPAALRTCHHLHGGLGLDVTYPLHRYSSLIRDLVRFLGGAEYCLKELGEQPCSSI